VEHKILNKHYNYKRYVFTTNDLIVEVEDYMAKNIQITNSLIQSDIAKTTMICLGGAMVDKMLKMIPQTQRT